MTHKPVEKPDEGVYRIPTVQPSLFGGVEGGRFLEDELRGRARSLGREDRFNILLSALDRNQDFKERVVKVLERVQGDDEAFRVTLDTLAYARRRDSNPSTYGEFKHTIRRLERCIEEGSLPIGKMRDLLEVGLAFDVVNYYATDEIIQKERNWVNGGERSLDGRIDIDFPSRGDLIAQLNGMQILHVHVGGRDITLAEASESVLMGVYASRIRSSRARERKAQRFLNTNDW